MPNGEEKKPFAMIVVRGPEGRIGEKIEFEKYKVTKDENGINTLVLGAENTPIETCEPVQTLGDLT